MKMLTLTILVFCFAFQTYLVYSDTTSTVPLTEQEIAGRHIWQSKNCQACHQIHGFGGFLGPDLTNSASRITKLQLEAQLLKDQGQMPVFELDQSQSDALWAFLQAIDKTGVGQARNPNLIKSADFKNARTSPANLAMGQVIADSADAQIAQGFELFQSKTCQACHVLFAKSSVGAPDLSLSTAKLNPEELMDVLEHGRLPMMPPTMLSEEDRESVHAFITFMGSAREEALSKVVKEPSPFWTSLPWWEY